jgi:predicted ArsR family transcriptional regulator
VSDRRAVAADDTFQQQAKALGDPTRLAIFRFVRGSSEPVSIASLTAHVQLHHNAVRQHVAKLVEADLVQAARGDSRGRGRPPVLYELHPSAAGAWQDESPYERLSVLLAEVSRTGQPAVEVGRRAGEQHASRSTDPAEALSDLTALMARLGFLPQARRHDDGAEIVLRNCPFASAALRDAATVCGLHLGLVEGFLRHAPVDVLDLVARDPRTAQCALLLSTAGPAATG